MNPKIWLATFAGTTIGPMQRVLGAYLVLYLKEDLNLSVGAAAGLLAVLMAGGAVGRLGLPRIHRRTRMDGVRAAEGGG